MILSVLLGALLYLSTASAQCPAISATDIVVPGPATFTASTGTSAIASTTSMTVLVQTCGEASLGPGATAFVDGGKITLRGTPGNLARATVTTGTIVIATSASVVVSGSASIQAFSGGGVIARTATATIDALVTASASAFGDGAVLDVKSAGVGAAVSAISSATATATASYTSASLRPRVGALYNGVVYVTGSPMNLAAGYGGQVIVFGSGQHTGFASIGGRLTATSNPVGHNLQGYITATLEVLEGSSNTISVGPAATATVGGANTAIVASGGTATLLPGVTATASSRGLVFVRSGVSSVTVRNSATATMDIGATVTAESVAVLASSDIATTVTSAGEAVLDGVTATVWVAARAQTGLIRRAEATMAVCPPKLKSCVTLSGGHRCIDTFSDIYNCGGCAMDGKGLDCTSLFDGQIACISGVCVPVEGDAL